MCHTLLEIGDLIYKELREGNEDRAEISGTSTEYRLRFVHTGKRTSRIHVHVATRRVFFVCSPRWLTRILDSLALPKRDRCKASFIAFNIRNGCDWPFKIIGRELWRNTLIPNAEYNLNMWTYLDFINMQKISKKQISKSDVGLNYFRPWRQAGII